MAEDEKQKVRNDFLSGQENSDRALSSGAIAEQLRALDIYKKSKQLYVAPAKRLNQIKINALADGKTVIVPTAALREGFFILKPYTVPFAKLSFAVTGKGMPQYATRLARQELSQLCVDLLVTDALAVDNVGYFISDGKGFFDIAYALLCRVNALNKGSKIFAVVEHINSKIAPLPHDPWDVQVDGVINETGLLYVEHRCGYGDRCKDILWEHLPLKRIKKIDPLWHIYSNIEGNIKS